MRTIKFQNLRGSDLQVDALYQGGRAGNAGDDPISKLLGTGNQGGFRYVGSISEGVKLCVLYSSLVEPGWPDFLDPETGRFTYFGDNRTPGHELHDTRRKGNEILRQTFDAFHQGQRDRVPPFFVFSKGPEGRDAIFRGLAVPGAPGVTVQEDLVAIWKAKEGERFQNYKAILTILDISSIPFAWISDLLEGRVITQNTPVTWKSWVDSGSYDPLTAPRTRAHRTRKEQLPTNPNHIRILETLVTYFKNHPRQEYAFEGCAAEIVRFMDSNITNCDVTRPHRDGGRDAIGTYRIGHQDQAINVVFALEAKCKVATSGSSVKDTSRLISRLRYRQFGIFITTSYVADQAYKEIIEDEHPIVIVAGADIARILVDSGYSTPDAVRQWLEEVFTYDE